jgi:BirA family transcriptional regulator, biotin operon repressor / biotin---[acetyl-CoA-carboxylase] ligase
MAVTPDTTWPDGVGLIEFSEIGSTNAEAMERLRTGASQPTWLRADQQHGGKGRAGRAWVSPLGNLYATYLASIPSTPPRLATLSLAAGVALVEALAALAPGVPFRLKWPNDVLVGDAKLAGILVESMALGDGLGIAVGFGVNLAAAPALPDRPTKTLAMLGPVVSPQAALPALAQRLSPLLDLWQAGNTDAILSRWAVHGPAHGTYLTVRQQAESVTGRFAGLDVDGALRLIGETGVVRRITFGDVEA